MFSSYNVSCMFFFFRSDFLALDNQFVCFSLGKTISPAPMSPQLPIVLYIGLRPCSLFRIHRALKFLKLFGYSFGITKRYILTEKKNIFDSLFPKTSSAMFFQPRVQGGFAEVSIGIWL